MNQMRCKRCGFEIDKDELHARFRAGLGCCPNPECNPVDWETSNKYAALGYNRLILKPTEFEGVTSGQHQ